MKGRRTIGGLVIALVAAVFGWWIGSAGNSGAEPTGQQSPTETLTVTVTATPQQPQGEQPTEEAAAPSPTDDSGAVAGGTDPESGLQVVAYTDLPPEAHDTIKLIENDGPYPYDQDGTTFQNREGILPDQNEGYYREFTVETPGSDDRGARRIVAGDGGEQYYTDDHYESFRRIGR